MQFEGLSDKLAAWGIPDSLLHYDSWIYQIFAVVFLTLLASLLVKIGLDRMYRLAKKTDNPWDDIFVDSARRPIRLLVWLLGFSWAATVTQDAAESPIFKFIHPVRSVGVVVLIAWFLVTLVRQFERVLQHPSRTREALDATTAGAIGKLLRASIIITSLLVALQTLGFSISGVLAFGGIGGIAVGFAAKDLLANFFGGLMVYLDRPFLVGEWVRSPDKNIEGTVEHIGWRLTRIRTFDKRPLYVPNATFATIALENPSRMTHRRINETVGLRYCDIAKVRLIMTDVKAMLVGHPEIDEAETLMVNFNQFNASSLDFFVYCFTKTTNWIRYQEVKQDVLLKVAEIIAQHDAEIAFPTQTLHVQYEPESAGT